MTREEAIQMLKEMKSEECYKALIDLCDMAISALSIPIMEYPQVDGITPHLIDEPSDLISRAEAVKAIHKKCDEEGLLGRYDIEWTLDEVPSVSAERIKAEKDCRNCKYGKWNDHFDNYLCYNPKNCTDWDLWESEECVSAERVGKWQYEKMVMPLSNHTKDYYRCSVCHTHWDCETTYCPNCGARMENK